MRRAPGTPTLRLSPAPHVLAAERGFVMGPHRGRQYVPCDITPAQSGCGSVYVDVGLAISDQSTTSADDPFHPGSMN